MANRDVDICPERAAETFGKGWRSRNPPDFNKPFGILKARVKTELERIDLTVNKQTLLTFVYAAALCPERWIVKFLLELFEREDEKLKAYNAEAAMAARKVSNFRYFRLVETTSSVVGRRLFYREATRITRTIVDIQ